MKGRRNRGLLSPALAALLAAGMLFGIAQTVAAFSYRIVWPNVEGSYPTYPPRATNGGYSTGNYYYQPVASALSVSCAPMDTIASIGRPITWFSSVTGGVGNYSYIWGGTDNLVGYTSSIQRAYATAGDKFATVTVTSGTQIITVGCIRGVSVQSFTQAAPAVALPVFGVSCFAAQERIAPGESVSWLSVVSGISSTATTTYEWQGSDGLTGTGPAVFKTYTSQGLKHALLTVTSGRDRAVAACTNAVTVAPHATAPATATKPSAPPIQAICAAAKAKEEVGKEVFWSARATGGTGEYAYRWEGDENLAGAASTTAKTYETEGVKQAKVTVSSGGKNSTVACAQGVEIVPRGLGLFAAVFLSDWFNTSSLVLAALLATAVGFYLAERKKRKEKE